MKNKIINKLTSNPSYMKRGCKNLAALFGCSERTIRQIMNDLKPQRIAYLNKFKNQD